MEYILIHCSLSDIGQFKNFASSINHHLNHGFILYGNSFIITGDIYSDSGQFLKNNTTLCQAMIRNETLKPNQ